MARQVRQIAYPNINVPAIRGYCLKYVDDGVNAPQRKPTAQSSWDSNSDKRSGEPPVGVWVPIFFSLTKGPYSGLGHVAWAFNHGDGWIEIHDSETQPKARAVYRSINEVLAWFANYSPIYLGWSLSVDGAKMVQEYDVPESDSRNVLVPAKGTATVQVDALNVRNQPDKNSASIAVYSKGQTFNYDGYIVVNGFVWLSYVSYSGARRYVAEGPDDGNNNTVYVSGGV